MYTANSELAPLLALGKLPGVTVGDIQQIIFNDSKIENKVPSLEPDAGVGEESPLGQNLQHLT